MNLQLDGKVVLVTGASAGIGDGIARVLAHEGVRLAITVTALPFDGGMHRFINRSARC